MRAVIYLIENYSQICFGIVRAFATTSAIVNPLQILAMDLRCKYCNDKSFRFSFFYGFVRESLQQNCYKLASLTNLRGIYDGKKLRCTDCNELASVANSSLQFIYYEFTRDSSVTSSMFFSVALVEIGERNNKEEESVNKIYILGQFAQYPY